MSLLDVGPEVCRVGTHLFIAGKTTHLASGRETDHESVGLSHESWHMQGSRPRDQDVQSEALGLAIAAAAAFRLRSVSRQISSVEAAETFFRAQVNRFRRLQRHGRHPQFKNSMKFPKYRLLH